MVVLTLLCPKSSCMYRKSVPFSNKWVANECRKVCGVAFFCKPALSTAYFDRLERIFYLLIALFVVGYIPATVRLAPTCANRFSLGFQFFVEAKINTNLEGSVMDYFFDLNHLQFKLKCFLIDLYSIVASKMHRIVCLLNRCQL